jgi:hypothetical protein
MRGAPHSTLARPRPKPKARRGTETRKQSALFAMRMTEDDRRRLDEAAREQGFKDAKALVLYRLRQDLGGELAV